MAIVKIKEDGKWIDAISVISDADTLDGKHADAFALATELNELQNLVGEKSVADQVFTLEQKVSQVLNNYYTKNDIENKNFASETYVDEAIASIPTPDVSGQINEHNASDTAHAGIREAIAANTSAIELLTNGASAEEIDSVNDLIQYVNEHGSEVTGMKADIKANTDAIAGVESLIGDMHEGKTIAQMIVDVEGGAIAYADELASGLQTALDGKLEYTYEIEYGNIKLLGDNELASMAYGNGKFVAVIGDISNSAAYSEDGINWIETEMPISAELNDITYGNGKFVAVGFSGAVAYSEDGINWTGVDMSSDIVHWRAITYGNGKFVAVGSNDMAAYSEDGINWTGITLSVDDEYWMWLTYGNGKFVAVGLNGAVAYSEDGINWTEVDMPSDIDLGNYLDIAYGNGKFVILANDSSYKKMILWSEDGISWSKQTQSPPYATMLAFGNGKFVTFLSAYSSTSTDTISCYTSIDGLSWTKINTPFPYNIKASKKIHFVHDKFIVGCKDMAMISEDGINWTIQKEVGRYYVLSQNNTDITEDIKDMLGINEIDDAVAEKVSYVAQTLAEEQKAQARANIGAGVPQVQTDYAQNDSTAPDYVKNRLAWTSGGLETILDTTLNIEVRDTDVQYAYLGVLHLVEGEEYIVSFDYDEYNCLCRIENIDGNNILALGNANLYDSDKSTTGEPFFVKLYERDGEIVGELYTLSYGEIQFSIHKFIEVVHQINEKYIPDEIARSSDIPSIEGLATETYVNTQIDTRQPIGDYALKSNIPTSLSQLTADSTHRLVTDTEKSTWNSKANGTHTHKADDIRGGYLACHPENSNNTSIIPFIYNDLAFLQKRGGSVKIYKTTDTDYTALTLSEETVNYSAPENLFDGSPSYCGFTNLTRSDVIVIDINLHRSFAWNTKFYIDYGNSGWAPKNFKLYVMNSASDTNYILKDEYSNQYKEHWDKMFSHKGGAGFNRIRLVLNNFNGNGAGTNGRIAQIGLINFGSQGVKETFVSRGGCNGIYGNLLPNKNSDIDLGSSEKHWKTVYADKVVGALPEVTESDAGKFLRVSGAGSIIAETIPYAEEVAF